MNLFDLYAQLHLDKSDYEKGLDEAEKKGSSVGSTIGAAVKNIAAVSGAAIAAGATALAAISKQAVEAYADYEQLEGGVETLFGAGGQSLEEYAASLGKTTAEVSEEYNSLITAQTAVLSNADQAYKTAGLSANEYMDTVTSFSASLIASLGGDTEAAAAKADQAVVQMADNANKMGTDIASIQTAYQGFAKQNYTMLDNLKLGYGGTKEEMERLLADAEELQAANGNMVDYSIDSYADIVDAIKVVQDNMGITGTTAKEASETISGSIASTKAAWENLLTGLANGDADLSGYIEGLISSATDVVKNVIPVVEQVFKSIPQVIDELLPVAMDEIPKLINEFLPELLSSGADMTTSIVQGLVDNLGELTAAVLQIFDVFATTILENLPLIIEAGATLLINLAQGIAQMLPELIPTIVDVVLEITEVLIDNVDLLIDGAIALIEGLAEGLINALPTLLEKAPEIIEKLCTALANEIPKLLVVAGTLIAGLVTGLIQNLPQILKSGVEIIGALINGIENLRSNVRNVGLDLVNAIGEGISGAIDAARTWGQDMIDNFIQGIKDKISALVNSLESIAGTVADYLGFSEPEKGPLSNFHTYAPDMMDLFAQGIRENEKTVTDQIKKSFDFGTIGSFDLAPTDITGSAAAYGTAGSVFNQTINVNQQISTPDELAQKVRLESRYGLIAGGALG